MTSNIGGQEGGFQLSASDLNKLQNGSSGEEVPSEVQGIVLETSHIPPFLQKEESIRKGKGRKLDGGGEGDFDGTAGRKMETGSKTKSGGAGKKKKTV